MITLEQTNRSFYKYPSSSEDTKTLKELPKCHGSNSSPNSQVDKSIHGTSRRKRGGEALPKSSTRGFVQSITTDHNFKRRWKTFFRIPYPDSWSCTCLFVVIWLLVTMFSSPAQGQVTSNSFGVWENELAMDEERRYVVQWTPAQDRILFRITARTRGYIGFGFHSKPRMKGADIVVGWVHSGKIYLQDRFGRGNEAPVVDRQQDWDLIGGFENDTHTVLTMSRPYITCDPNDHPITNDTIRLLWAYHPDDPVDPESPRPRLHYHGGSRRGATTLFLLQRASEALPRKSVPLNRPKLHFHQETFESLDPHLYTWSLVGPQATIEPSADSIHWCRLFKRPQLSRKHHVVRYEPVLTGDGAREVHHMMVYECVRLSQNNEAVFAELAQTEGTYCNIGSMEKFMAACNHIVVAWALGSQGVWLPPEAGYPLTPDGPVFYMLETHYNMSQKEPMKDSSGVRLLYTPFLRKYDAGVLSVGLHPNWKHIIPPKQVSVLSEGHCIAECSRAAFPPTGINIFGVIFHTHLLGRKVRLRHLRDDVEFEPIASDYNYDFTYQDYRALRQTRTVLPGDHLIGECVYDSRKCSSITLGGFKTREEMCLSFVFYYPKADLSLCHSEPSLGTVLQSLGIQKLSSNSNQITIRLPMELAGRTLKWRLQNYDWENQFEHFQSATHAGTFNAMCRGPNLSAVLNQDYSYPNVSKEWREESPCEREKSKSRPRKKKGEGGSSAELGHPPHEDTLGEDLTEDDVMVDDGATQKLIERIDVDPVSNFDLFMPVIGNEGDFKGVETANFGGSNAPPSGEDETSLMSELEQLQKGMEEEFNKEHSHEVSHTPEESNNQTPVDTVSRTTRTRALFLEPFYWGLFVFVTGHFAR